MREKGKREDGRQKLVLNWRGIGHHARVMHVISRKRLREFCKAHADSCEALYDWYDTANQANWQNLIEVQQIYPKAEAVNNFTVFNIKGNRYRLITDIQYLKQLIYVKYILTHAEYDKEQWKNDPYY